MVVRPVGDWFTRPRYGGRELGLKFSCGHVRWVKHRGQAMRLWGQHGTCTTCNQEYYIIDVLDWRWIPT